VASTPLKLIAELVTPAVMISAAGLLLLGLHSKYSNIVTRIRSIIDRRNELEKMEGGERAIANLNEQVRFLLFRAWCARNAVFCLYLSILLMIGTSICYALAQFGLLTSGKVAVGIFLGGIAALFVACIFAFIEVQFAYRVIRLEVERHEGES